MLLDQYHYNSLKATPLMYYFVLYCFIYYDQILNNDKIQLTVPSIHTHRILIIGYIAVVIEYVYHKPKNNLLFQYASVEKDGQKYMTSSDLIRKYILMFQHENYNEDTINLLAGVADSTGDG